MTFLVLLLKCDSEQNTTGECLHDILDTPRRFDFRPDCMDSRGQPFDGRHYTYKTLPDSGHWILESDSEKINTWLLEHMKK